MINRSLLRPAICSLLISTFFGSGNYLQAQEKPKPASSTNKVGIGIRIGDPTGLTAKFYLKKMDIELNVGRAYRYGNYDWRAEFYTHSKYSNPDYYNYDRISVYAPIDLQLHFLAHRNFKDFEGLSWYIGGGPQVRFRTIDYFYKYKDFYGSGKNDFVWVAQNDRVLETNAGVDGVIGMEYGFNDLPLSIFADVNVYMEIFDHPFLPGLEGGIGFRYNFR